MLHKEVAIEKNHTKSQGRVTNYSEEKGKKEKGKEIL
jgi:hypothetical protein